MASEKYIIRCLYILYGELERKALVYSDINIQIPAIDTNQTKGNNKIIKTKGDYEKKSLHLQLLCKLVGHCVLYPIM